MPVRVRAFDVYKVRDNHTIIRDMNALDAMVRSLRGKKLVLDCETSGLNWWAGQKPVGIALAAEGVGPFYVAFGHYTGQPQLDFKEGYELLNRLICSAPLLIMHNAKFDLQMLWAIGIRPNNPIYDTMVAAYLVDEYRGTGLKDRAADELGMTELKDAETVLNTEVSALAKYDGESKTAHKDKYGYSRVCVNLVGDYACLDVEGTLGLYQNYERNKISERHRQIFESEMRLIRIAAEMERYGLCVDEPYLQELQQTLMQDKDLLEETIKGELGIINVNSAAALRKRLGELGVPLSGKTKGGEASVSRDALEPHAELFPVVGDILDYRATQKLHSAYAVPLYEHAVKGRIHANISTVGARTGRMACSRPNLMAIPRTRENEEGIDPDSVRRAFVVPENCVRLFADYSQMEMRILAEYSRDPELLAIFASGEDVHTETAVRVFGVGDKQHRQIAKAINFGLIYGMAAPTLAAKLGIEKAEAKAHMERYFAKFAGIEQYKNNFLKKLRTSERDGGMEGRFANIFGRPHRIRDLKARNWALARRAERHAVNYLIQGTAADVMKVAVIKVHNWIKQNKVNAHLVLCIHDELQIDCREEDAAYVSKSVVDLMTDFPELQAVPLKVDIGFSRTNWAEKREAA